VTVWFWDVSNHQAVTPPLNGWDGLIAKASEGANFRDARFRQHLDVARAAGKVHGAYHFLRSDASVREQVATFTAMCPRDVAAIPDVESVKNSSGRVISAPTLAQTREFVDRLQQLGYHVPMMYLPRWYWTTWGSPSLVGLPPLWGSWYPDYVARPREEAWKLIPSGARVGFGGLPQVALQFTSSPLDQNRSEYTPQQFYDFMSTTRRVEMPLNRDTDKEEFNALMTTWWLFHSRTRGGRPTWEDGPTAPEMLTTLLDRAVADVDEAALAAELVKQGVGDVDVAQVKRAFTEVLAGTRLAPAPADPKDSQ
jgi:hypothetical protein